MNASAAICWRSDLAAQLGALLCLDLLFGQDGCEIFHLKDLAGFDFVVAGAAVGATLDPLDGLFKGLDLQDRETGDELLGFGEGAVDDGARLAGELDACAFGAGMEAIEAERGGAWLGSSRSHGIGYIELACLLQQRNFVIFHRGRCPIERHHCEAVVVHVLGGAEDTVGVPSGHCRAV
jgi:hypothetical protein